MREQSAQSGRYVRARRSHLRASAHEESDLRIEADARDVEKMRSRLMRPASMATASPGHGADGGDGCGAHGQASERARSLPCRGEPGHGRSRERNRQPARPRRPRLPGP